MARHHGRELALKILFEHDLAATGVDALLERGLDREAPDDAAFAGALVRGTVAHQDDVDHLIESASIDWRIHRMPTVDRNILRLAVFELCYSNDLPISVIIDEAVELAGSYSTTEAKKFVNGVLSTVAKQVRPHGDPPAPAGNR